MLDVNGQSIGDGTLELVKFAETASAVNEITVTNSATGNAPEIAATGDDTNIDLKLTPKGTGKLNLDGIKFPNADGSSGQALTTNGSGILSFSTISADGTADWDTSVKTTGFTATANKGYFCNTTSAGFTVTLPATPSAGDEVIVLDYAGTFDTNALIINPNSNKIEGATDNLKLSGEREGVRLVYIDTTQGWLAYSGINEGTDALSPVLYSVDFLVIAGGGAGRTAANYAGGGGGAGGYRTSTQTVNPGVVITVTVGDGGSLNASGSNSSISGTGLSTITSAGGGLGGVHSGAAAGTAGGSGGGGGSFGATNGTGGAGNTPSTSPSQGNGGGNGGGAPSGSAAGGGGGAGATGQTGVSYIQGGAGGTGTASSITGSSVTRAGGGGGGSDVGTAGAGGAGGGGNGASGASGVQNGTANTGGGAGGGTNSVNGGTGGKGVVILSMPDANYTGTTTGSPTVATGVSGKTVLTFTGTGSYTT
jgi:hypothetical protein